jgi:hypothetical protein
VHGSVAINTDEPSRYAAYAQFWPMEEHAKRKREEAAQLATPRKFAKRGEAAQLATPQKPASKVSRVHATLAAAVGRPHRSGARWSSNQLQAWMMQLPQHTRAICPKAGRWYVCPTCGRRDKKLVSMEESACLGFIPDILIKTKLRRCITWCRKNESMEEGSMAVRKNSSMLWLEKHQMDVIPMEARLPSQVPPSVATAEGCAEMSPGMVATSALSDRTGEAATPVIPPPGAAPVEHPANPASPASVHSSQSGP